MIRYFFGPDTYRARQAIDALAKKMPAKIRWLDKEDLLARPLSEWLSQSNGLFGKELAVVRDASALPKALQEQVVEIVKKGSAAEVIVWDRGAPDKRTVLFKSLQKSAQEFSYESDDSITKALITELKTQQVTLEPGAAKALIAALGRDGWRLRSEAEKLGLRASPVTAQHVQGEVPPAVFAEVFQMLESLAKGARAQAVVSVQRLLQQGESELYVLSMLAYQFRTMLQIRRALDEGVPAGEMVRATGLSPFSIQKNLPLAKRFSSQQLLDILTKILATDFTIKQGKVEARTALLMLVMSLAPATAPRVLTR